MTVVSNMLPSISAVNSSDFVKCFMLCLPQAPHSGAKVWTKRKGVIQVTPQVQKLEREKKRKKEEGREEVMKEGRKE